MRQIWINKEFTGARNPVGMTVIFQITRDDAQPLYPEKFNKADTMRPDAVHIHTIAGREFWGFL